MWHIECKSRQAPIEHEGNMGIDGIYLWAKHDALALPHLTSFSEMASYIFSNDP